MPAPISTAVVKQFADVNNSNFLKLLFSPFVSFVVDIIKFITSCSSWSKKHDWPLMVRNMMHALGIFAGAMAGFIMYATMPAVRSFFMDCFSPLSLGDTATLILAGYVSGHVFGYVADFMVDYVFKIIFQTAFGDTQYFLTERQKNDLQLFITEKKIVPGDRIYEFLHHVPKYCVEIIRSAKPDDIGEWVEAFESLKNGDPMHFIINHKAHMNKLKLIQELGQGMQQFQSIMGSSAHHLEVDEHRGGGIVSEAPRTPPNSPTTPRSLVPRADLARQGVLSLLTEVANNLPSALNEAPPSESMKVLGKLEQLEKDAKKSLKLPDATLKLAPLMQSLKLTPI